MVTPFTGVRLVNLIIISLQKWQLTSKRQQIIATKRPLHHENARLNALAPVE